MRAIRIAAVASTGALLLGATGCSGDAKSSTDESTTTPTQTSPTVEAGTTEPGTEVDLGKEAVVRYHPNPGHNSLIALRVTKVKKGSVDDLKQFKLNDDAKKSTVYYVSVAVKNVSKGNLSGQPVPLYGKVTDKLVVPPVVFGSSFGKCSYRPLPAAFKKGEKADLCLVMLAPKHGKISEIQWRPADNAAPISWTLP